MHLEKDVLINADEAAKLTSLHAGTLRKMAAQHRIRSYKVLNCLRFKRSDLERLIVERAPSPKKGK